MHLFQTLESKPGVGHLQHGDDHQCSGGVIDVEELIDREEDDQGNKLDKLFHALVLLLTRCARRVYQTLLPSTQPSLCCRFLGVIQSSKVRKSQWPYPAFGCNFGCEMRK